MTKIEKSSGNVFADLGFPNAETHAMKARLVERITALIEARGMTQVRAAALFGMSQPDVSKMLRGQFRPISIERLMQCLLALGDSIEVSVGGPNAVKLSAKAPKRGKLSVLTA
jgi:predicted XRE-type DNA-binding protein